VFGLALFGCEVEPGEEADAGDTGGGADAAEPGLCDDLAAFQDSCLSTFFSCYDPSGTCTVEDIADQADIQFDAIRWSNGAEWQVGSDPVDGDITIIALDSGGGTCAQGLGSEDTPGEPTVTFSAPGGSDELVFITDNSGNVVIECPDGNDEIYTETEANALMACGFGCGTISWVVNDD
jgi:hypothetical protein